VFTGYELGSDMSEKFFCLACSWEHLSKWYVKESREKSRLRSPVCDFCGFELIINTITGWLEYNRRQDTKYGNWSKVPTGCLLIVGGEEL